MSEGSIFELTAHRSWNEYVNKHPKGSVFHTREMFRVFEDTPSHTPMWIGARDSNGEIIAICLLYTSPSPRDRTRSRMPSSA